MQERLATFFFDCRYIKWEEDTRRTVPFTDGRTQFPPELLERGRGHEQLLPGHEQFLLYCHIRARVISKRHEVTNSSRQVTNSSYFIVTRVPEPVGKKQMLRSGPLNKRPMTKLHVNK